MARKPASHLTFNEESALFLEGALFSSYYLNNFLTWSSNSFDILSPANYTEKDGYVPQT
jgi:hypothetical protein